MNTTQIHAELQQITAIIEQITGLVSNWNGEVELVVNAGFKGKKPFTCGIQIDAVLAAQEARWRTLIHESLHAVSVGYTRRDYMENVGWEEGVVEQLQRLLRSTILQQIGVPDAEKVFVAVEQDHAYNAYIQALESVRLAMGEEDAIAFYLALLRTPIRDRYASLLRGGLQRSAEERRRLIETLSAANAVLKEMSL